MLATFPPCLIADQPEPHDRRAAGCRARRGSYGTATRARGWRFPRPPAAKGNDGEWRWADRRADSHADRKRGHRRPAARHPAVRTGPVRHQPDIARAHRHRPLPSRPRAADHRDWRDQPSQRHRGRTRVRAPACRGGRPRQRRTHRRPV